MRVIGGDFLPLGCISRRLLSPPGHQSFVTIHAKDALRRPGITQVLYLLFTVSAFETVGAESLITSQNRKVFYFVSAVTAAVCAIIADKGSIAQKE